MSSHVMTFIIGLFLITERKFMQYLSNKRTDILYDSVRYMRGRYMRGLLYFQLNYSINPLHAEGNRRCLPRKSGLNPAGKELNMPN
jgi:microsomal dipeptidase-like Zn-dependent dipeptidase